MFNNILIAFFVFLNSSAISAQTIVRTSEELKRLLTEDCEQGNILLDGDIFQLSGAEVKAGGRIKPYPGRKPVLIGFHQKVEKGNRKIDEVGYWTVPIKSYGYSQIVFLDENLEAIPYSCHINGKDGFDVKAKQIETIKKEQRIVRTLIPSGFEYLKNKEKPFFKNFSIKMGYWFVGITLNQIYSDDTYLYGCIDNAYNLDLLSNRPNSNVHLEFFNLPKEGNGIFLDGNDVLHVKREFEEVRVCTTPALMKLVGDRELYFENITFSGANTITIDVQGSNKHFKNCVIRNCGSGIEASNGCYSDCSVENCIIENLYDNRAIQLRNVNNVLIKGNTIRHTGTLMKGGSVISVGGLNFSVSSNNISDFSYNAISAGITRDYKSGTMSGIISENVVDNAANWGKAENQLTDGGGIYVLTHTDGVVIENNIVRNIGYDGCELWGIYLDDGAYNCTVRRNLVYNMWPGQYAMTARYVEECERSNMNNVFENNIFIGPCKMAGNRKGFGNKTIIRDNYIVGDLNTQGEEYVTLDGNRFVSATVRKDGRIVFGKGSRVKKSGFLRSIKKLIIR